MVIRITAIRQAGGSLHEHITWLWWTNPADGTHGDASRGTIIDAIEDNELKAYVEDAAHHRVDVGVVVPAYGPRYLRTYADGIWTDNLLSLPRR